MVRLPGPDDIQGIGVTRPRVVSASADDFGAQLGRAQADEARAVQGIGQSIQNIAQIGNELMEERQSAEDRVFLDTFDLEYSRTANRDYIEAQTQMPSGGQGFTQSVDQQLQETPEQIIQRLQEGGFNPSERALQAAQSSAMQTRASTLVKAQTWEHNQRVAALGSRFDESVDGLEQQAMEDGNAEEALVRLYESAEAYQGVIPASDLSAKTIAAEQRIVQSSISGLVQAGRLDEAEELTERFFGGRTAPQGDEAAALVTDKIIQVESGGDPNASNPRSSAAGLGQFIDSTWVDMVKRHRPDLAEGRSKSEIVAMKGNASLSRQMTEAYAQENAQSLQDAGFDATPGNIYLAHFAGPDGAKKVLGANAGASVASVLGQETIDANPFLEGMTVGDLRGWAAGKMGGDGGDPLMANASRAIENYDVIDSVRKQVATASASQEKTAYAEHKGAMELGILTGEVKSEQTILNDTVLEDDDKATLLRSFRTNQDAETEAQTFLRNWSEGTARDVNPYDSGDRGLVDKAYSELLESVPDEQRGAASAQFIADTGVVPRQAVADVRNNLMSNDVAAVQQGMEQAAALRDAAPRGLDAAQSGQQIIDAATMYDELVNERGYSAEDAAQRLLDSRDPDKQQRRDVLADRWKDESENFAVNDVLAGFGDNFLPGGPVAGLTPEAELSVAADYMEFAEEAFMGAAQGDTDLAKKMALEEMQRTYGVSAISSQEVIMRYPPENFYPAIDGSQEYVRAMAMQDAKSLDTGAKNVMLTAATETAQDVRSGKLPRYDLWYQTEDEVWNLAPQQFIPDPEKMRRLSEISSEERQIRFGIERDFGTIMREQGGVTPQSLPVGIPSVLGQTTGLGMSSPENTLPDFEQRQQRLDELERERGEMTGIRLPQGAGQDGPSLSERIAPGNQGAQ